MRTIIRRTTLLDGILGVFIAVDELLIMKPMAPYLCLYRGAGLSEELL